MSPASQQPSSRLLPLLESLPPTAAIAPCRAGCAACCMGPFDISPAEVAMVKAAVAMLPAVVAAEIEARASEQRHRYHELEPDWGSPWNTDQLTNEQLDRLCDALSALPCPALDPVTHHCLIHQQRPANCRITGTAIIALDGGVLDNVCPIQEKHPGWAALPPIAFDLESWEDAVELIDRDSETRNFHRTTVAGALGN